MTTQAQAKADFIASYVDGYREIVHHYGRAVIVNPFKPAKPLRIAPRPRGLRKLWAEYKRSGMTEERFAAWCGISRQTIFGSWFARNATPHRKSVAIVLARTGININTRKRGAAS
jgi:hypothetical protein